MITMNTNKEKVSNLSLEEAEKGILPPKWENESKKWENDDLKSLETQEVEKQELADNREDIAEFVQEYREEMTKRAMNDDFKKEELVIDGVKHQVLKTDGLSKQVKVEEGKTWLVILSEKIRKMWHAWQKEKKQEKI